MVSKTISLDSLKKGLPTLTEAWGSFLAEAGLYCLETEGHCSGVTLKVINSKILKDCKIIWSGAITPKIKSSWGDEDEATEFGAMGIAVLLATNFTEYKSIERAAKGGGFDYWVGNPPIDENLPFEKKMRLEVSGIRNGAENSVKTRLSKKIKQTSKSSSALPTYVIIVEFSNPLATFSQNEKR